MQPAHDKSASTPIDPGVEAARSFYLLEESWPVIGEIGDLRSFATTAELHARLEPKLHHDSSGRLHNELLLGQSVNVWTVQQGRLAAGLDVTEFVSARLPSGATTTVFELNRHQWDFSSGKRADPPPPDEGARLFLGWDGIIARLPPLEAPLASPGDKDLTVRLDGDHTQPLTSSPTSTSCGTHWLRNPDQNGPIASITGRPSLSEISRPGRLLAELWVLQLRDEDGLTGTDEADDQLRWPCPRSNSQGLWIVG